jgi:hypothetical protein
MAGIRDPYTFTFDQQETETLLQGLGKLPAERSYNLLTRMGQEIAQENQRRQAPAVPPLVTPEGTPIASAPSVQ